MAAACSSQAPSTQIACFDNGSGCACNIIAGDYDAGAPVACNPEAFPGTTCCAGQGWPQSDDCNCFSNAVACGIVPGFFEAVVDGGPTDGCVCTAGGGEVSQVVGATCQPGVGVCCFYPGSLPERNGVSACACGSGFNCEPGSMRVASCSAASFPSAALVDCGTRKMVASCSVGVAAGTEAGNEDGPKGLPDDGGVPPGDASGAGEGGVCGSGPAGACNQVKTTGSAVTPACTVGSPPAMTGGTIADGTYVLTSATAYTFSAAACSGLPQGGPTTLVFAGGCLQSADANGGAKTYTWSAAGTSLTFNEVCPATGSATLSYTATATTLSELAPLSTSVANIVSVFTKQ